MLLNKILAILALVFGGLGIVVCLAGSYAVWRIGSRLEQTNEHLAELVDNGLSAVQARVAGVQKRVAESRITAQDFANILEEQAKRQIKDQLVVKLELEQRTEGLSKRLDAASHWLDLSSESIRNLQRLVEVGKSLGASLNTSSLNDLLERLATSQKALEQAIQQLQDIRTSVLADESDENRRTRIATLLARILVTISDVDDKLGKGVERLEELQTLTRQAKDKVSRDINIATMVGHAILFWMAAGQTALCWWGWKYGFARRRAE
jgi:hypothetical protein